MLATPIEVKKAYKEGTHRKNYRFVVLNDDGTEDFTIDNDTLVAESVHIDERMATGSELKFGLCEGSSLEFQYFDHPNINGRTVQAFIDIYYDDVNTHSTPMGYFTVKECPRQFSTGIYKVTAYNKLQSDYLDAEANSAIIDIVNQGEAGESDASFFYILRTLLGEYNIETYNVLNEFPDITSAELNDDLLFDDWLSQHGAAVQEVVFPIYTSSDSLAGYLHVRAFLLAMGQPSQYYDGYYDQFEFNANVAKNITQAVYKTGAIDSHLDDRYVHDYNSGDKISLRDFLLDGVCLTTRVVSSPTITFDTQKNVVGGDNFGQRFFDFLNEFLYHSKPNPCVTIVAENIKDVSVFPYESIEGERVFFDTLYNAEEYYFSQKEKIKKFSSKKERLTSVVTSSIKKAKKRLVAIISKEKDALNAEENRIKGELILSNIYRIKQGDKSVEVVNYYDGTNLVIALDEYLSPSKNAEAYYKKYNKQKRTHIYHSK